MAEKRVAIITGASSGIGMATGIAFARRGYAVVLAARRAERLEQVAAECRRAGAAKGLAGGDVLVVPTDVNSERQVNDLVARAVETFGRVDVMVNNAGYGLFDRVHETSEADMRAIFDTNFFGVFHGCKAAAAVMIRQRSGHIFNVSSILGKRGSPFHGAYSATKFAVMGLTDSLRVELLPYSVRVTAVCPALTDTEFFQHSNRARQAGQSFRRFKRLRPASSVARAIVRAVGRRRPELLLTLGGKTLVRVSQLWPALADRMMKLYHDDLVKHLSE